MSQANPTIGPNKSGLSYRQEDNDGKKALLNHHKGASAPSYAEAGMIWLDDAATPWVLKFYDGSHWLPLMQLHAGNNTVLPYLGTNPLRVPILATDSGSTNAYAVAPVPAISGYAAGQMFLLRPGAANTGTSTLAVNGLSATTIKMPDGSDTPPGVLKTSGTYLLMHTGTHFSLMNPTASLGGGCLQYVSSTHSSSTVLSVSTPVDDTVPTSSEGTEVLSVSITPKSATSKMVITAQGFAGYNGNSTQVLAVYANSSSSAFYATAEPVTASNIEQTAVRCEHAPGSLSPIVYKLRIGSATGAIRLNGNYAGRLLGGSASWLMTVEEYEQ